MAGRAPPAEVPWDLESFVSALTGQLDRLTDSLRVKSTTQRPLTFSVRDLELDLKVIPSYDQQRGVTFRSAQPSDQNASALTDEAELPSESRQRLERMGVSTIGDLRRLGADPRATAEVAQRAKLSIEDLARIIHGTRRPNVTGVFPAGDRPPRLRLEGANLEHLRDARVQIGEQPARLVSATQEVAEVELTARPRSPEIRIEVQGQPPIRIRLPRSAP